MSLKIRVSTFLGDNEEPETVRIVDHEDHLHRVWLGKHSFWALRNGRAVLTEPVED